CVALRGLRVNQLTPLGLEAILKKPKFFYPLLGPSVPKWHHIQSLRRSIDILWLLRPQYRAFRLQQSPPLRGARPLGLWRGALGRDEASSLPGCLRQLWPPKEEHRRLNA